MGIVHKEANFKNAEQDRAYMSCVVNDCKHVIFVIVYTDWKNHQRYQTK